MADSIERVAWLYLLNKARQLRQHKRRLWIHPILWMHSEFGEFNHLLQELHMDEVRFQRYFRLSRAQFDDLLGRIVAQISYQDTNYRFFIPPEECLSICLRKRDQEVCCFILQVQRCLQSTQPVPAARLPYRVKLSEGKRYAWCACGHSKKQPFCDGTHRAKAPNISPLLFTSEKNKTVMLCACKQTKNSPYCDGSHFKVIYRDVLKYVKGLFK